MLPRFQRLLTALQYGKARTVRLETVLIESRDPDKSPTPAQISEATRTRKRLMEAFTQYDATGRRIRDLPTTHDSQKKLQKNIYQQVTTFLHIHMLPLQALPKILKHASPHGVYSSGRLTPNGKPQGALAAIKFDDDARSQVSSSAISALEEEEKALRDRLIVLEEQKFFVSEMIADANKRRKFDEVSSLSQNVQDLAVEIDQLQGQLAQLDFAGAYSG